MKTKTAIDIVARQILANAADELEWEDMPDIGQYDFDSIVDRMNDLAPTQLKWNEAISLLERRAERGAEIEELTIEGQKWWAG